MIRSHLTKTMAFLGAYDFLCQRLFSWLTVLKRSPLPQRTDVCQHDKPGLFHFTILDPYPPIDVYCPLCLGRWTSIRMCFTLVFIIAHEVHTLIRNNTCTVSCGASGYPVRHSFHVKFRYTARVWPGVWNDP
jgi:hypothetical protein